MEIEKIPIDNLLLDEQNPRYPKIKEGQTQKDLINDLIEHENIIIIANSILMNGYFPMELLCVIKKDNKYIVIEGNRRLAACKWIVDSINPDTTLGYIRKLDKSLIEKFNKNSILELPCIVYARRDLLNDYLIERHAKDDIRKWDPIMKARFLRKILKFENNLDETAQKYNSTPREITRLLKILYLYDKACEIDYSKELDKEEIEKIKNPREFNITNLERVCCSKEGQDFLGIDKNIDGNIAETEFKKGLKKIVCDIVSNVIDSRKLQKKEDRKKYLDSIDIQYRPDKKIPGKFGMDNFLKKNSKKIGKKKSSPKYIQKTNNNQLLQNIECTIASTKIRSILEEIKKLDYKKFINATTVLTRCFLEMSLSEYLRRHNFLDKMQEEEKTRTNGHPNKHYPGLSDMLKYIYDKKTVISDEKILSTLKIIHEKEKKFFDYAIHNEAFCPSPESLFSIVGSLESLFKIILKE